MGYYGAMAPAPGDRFGEVNPPRPTFREGTGARDLVEATYCVLGARQSEEKGLVARIHPYKIDKEVNGVNRITHGK